MKSYNNTKTRTEKLATEQELLIEALQERNDYLVHTNKKLNHYINEMTKVFYKNLRLDCTYEEAIDLLDEWNANFKNIDTTGFLIDIVSELGIAIDREYLKELFNEKTQRKSNRK